MDLEFEDLFEGEILKRGREYDSQDLIYDVRKDGNWYEGLVDGTQEYHVKIEIDELGKIVNMRCTCPYGRRENCKHMAALLYYLKREKSIECKKEIEEQKFEENSKEDYNCRIDRTIEKGIGRKGYVTYYKTERFLERMYGYIQEAEDFIEKKEYELSFWIVALILEKMPHIDIDDSDGDMFPMASDCAEVIEKILQECRDEKIKNEILDWLHKAIKNNSLGVFSVVIEEMFGED